MTDKKPSAGSEAAKLRDEIDRGLTGDKVDHPDPAAAPLGTDDEAAGTLPPASVIAEMRRDQRSSAGESSRSRTVFYVILVLALLGVAAASWTLS